MDSKFLRDLMPSLFGLATSLFDRYQGDARRAVNDIETMQERIDLMRKARDKQLADKHGRK